MKNSITLNEQDLQVAKFLDENNITFKVNYLLDCANDKEWQHDLFNVVFSNVNCKRINTEYKIGLGHRVLQRKPTQVTNLSSKYKQELKKVGLQDCLTPIKEAFSLGSIYSKQHYSENSCYAVPPTQASVLYSLLSDADCGDNTFSDFCSEFGYDEDSRKALEIYLACQENSKQLKEVFTPSQIETLRELLEDY